MLLSTQRSSSCVYPHCIIQYKLQLIHNAKKGREKGALFQQELCSINLTFFPKKKVRTHVEEQDSKGTVGDGVKDKDIPRSLVVRSSVITPSLKLLIRDIRKVMSPYTALNLKERK